MFIWLINCSSETEVEFVSEDDSRRIRNASYKRIYREFTQEPALKFLEGGSICRSSGFERNRNDQRNRDAKEEGASDRCSSSTYIFLLLQPWKL